MSEQPLVSIILPTFNRAELLPNSIGSVLSQTYRNWELIIWDDGSEDQTGEVVSKFNDGRIQYHKDSNHGISYARNQAIGLAKGKYIAFLDSDDEWVNNKLELQMAVLQAHPQIDFLFSDFINFNLVSQEKRLAFDENAVAMIPLTVEELDKGLWLIKDGWLESLVIADYVATDTIILKKEVMSQIGGYNESIRNTVDFELKWRMGFNNTKFAYTNDILLLRNKPEGSLSSISMPTIENYLKALDLCKQRALLYGRKDLAYKLNLRYRNAWQNKIIIYGAQGEKKMAWRAFKQSLKYGFSLGSVKLIIKALFFANSLYSPGQR